MINTHLLISAYGLAALVFLYGLIWLIIRYSSAIYKILKSILISLGQAFLKNEYIEQLLKKNPRTVDFLRRRFSRRSFSGLAATLFGAVFLYISFLFFSVGYAVVKSETIVSADSRFNQLMILFRSEYFIRIFLFITSWGRWPTVVSVALIFSLILWLYKKRSYIWPFLLALIGSSIMNAGAKLAFHRPRPPFPVYLEKSFSFPSGHSTVVIAMYGFIIYFLLRHAKKFFSRTLILFFGLILTLAIGFSRLYLGVHYLSDVWAGYLLGAWWLILGIGWSQWQISRQNSKSVVNNLTAKSTPTKIKLTVAALVILEVIFLSALSFTYRPTQIIINSPVATQTIALDNLPAQFFLPRYTETITASPQEPLSFIIAAKSDNSLIDAMGRAGWNLADPLNDESIGLIIKAALTGGAYPTAPMTPSFWNGAVHNFGFEKPTVTDNISSRNHARFWRTDIRTDDGFFIYVGTASLDTGIKWGITHKIAPAIDNDREKLFQDLEAAGLIASFTKTPFVSPTIGHNFTGDTFFTDGQIYTIILK